MSAGFLKPKRPRVLLAAAVAAVALAAVPFFTGAANWRPGGRAGLGLGFAATGFMLLAGSYAARRPRARPLGTAQSYLQAHLYLGLLAFVAVLAHAGFRTPHGWLGWALLGLSAWTTITGALGSLLQKWVPATIASTLQVQAPFERVPALAGDLLADADAAAAGAGDVLVEFYAEEVRPSLVGLRPSWSYVLDARRGQTRALEAFARIAPYVLPEDQARLTALQSHFLRKRELDAFYSLQRLLRTWPRLHVPTTGLLLGLLVVHVVSWVRY